MEGGGGGTGMDLWGAGATAQAGASLASAAMTNQANREIADATNAANLHQAREAGMRNNIQAMRQQDFQERMSSSAYQRSTADMKKAGINPMLAYMQGGASSPQGAAGNNPAAQATTGAPMQNVLERGISTAMDTLRLKNETSKADASSKLDIAAAEAQSAKKALDTNSAAVEAKRGEALTHQMPAVKAEAAAREKQAEWDQKTAGPNAISGQIKTWLGIGQNVKDLANPLHWNPGQPTHQQKETERLRQRSNQTNIHLD